MVFSMPFFLFLKIFSYIQTKNSFYHTSFHKSGWFFVEEGPDARRLQAAACSPAFRSGQAATVTSPVHRHNDTGRGRYQGSCTGSPSFTSLIPIYTGSLPISLHFYYLIDFGDGRKIFFGVGGLVGGCSMFHVNKLIFLLEYVIFNIYFLNSSFFPRSSAVGWFCGLNYSLNCITWADKVRENTLHLAHMLNTDKGWCDFHWFDLIKANVCLCHFSFPVDYLLLLIDI